MPLEIGAAVGPYEIREAIGAGGMGEVYRATDRKLRRDVALKILPKEFAADPDRMERFQREAQTLAALNHPNIAHIHGLEESGGLRALVMELVDGVTLADRIAQGALPIDEVLSISKQIAEALEYAHEQGVVHRDLKPANIKITSAGVVKVLDFGLAKALVGEKFDTSRSNSPTLSLAATQAGVILGTAAYMSPEQAKGKAVDRRSDIWSFGVVLFEMLTGRALFSGETVSETMAHVMMKELDWTAVPSGTPPRLRDLLRRCLVRDVRQRLQAIGEARIALDEIRQDPSVSVSPPAAPVSSSTRRTMLTLAVLAITFLATSIGLAIKIFFRAEPEAVAVRFTVDSLSRGETRGRELFPQGQANISPDGRKVAFVALLQSRSVIWVHSFDSGVSQPLTGTEGVGPAIVTWSPDSRYIAFSTEDGKLKKVAATGGPPQVIGNVPRAGGTATWGVSDVILSGPGQEGTLWRVTGAGGERVQVTQATQKDEVHRFPTFLPDGRHFLYVAISRGELAAYVGSLDSTDRRPLRGIGSEVKYAPSGHVLFVRDGSLMAQPFDLKRLELSGEPFPVADSFAPANAIAGSFSISATGTLAFRPQSIRPSSQLFWVDRAGKSIAPVGPVGEMNDIELSPDEKFVAFEAGVPADIWALEVETGVVNRVTSDKSRDADPVWSPDGRSIAFRGDRNGGGQLYERQFGVVADDKQLLKSESRDSPDSWSRDGRYLAYEAVNDIWALPLTGDRKPIRIAGTASRETNSQISPDGHWIAYQSDESGRMEIHVQSFPQPGAKQQVSSSGGLVPRWSRDGKELFFLAPNQMLMAVAIRLTAASLSVGAPRPLFEMHVTNTGEGNYDVSSTGRFLVNIPTTVTSQSPITVVLNWAAGLNK